MSDPRIAQLRAKADSTTFPAEAAALRAKADELEARQPPPRVSRPINGARVTDEWRDEVIRFPSDWQDRAADIMAKMAEAMKEQEARQEAMRASEAEASVSDAERRYASFNLDNIYNPRQTTEWTGITFTKVTDVNGRTYWTRTE